MSTGGSGEARGGKSPEDAADFDDDLPRSAFDDDLEDEVDVARSRRGRSNGRTDDDSSRGASKSRGRGRRNRDDDSGNDASSGRSGGVPTWKEIVNLMVDNNLQNRSRNSSRGGRGGGGSGGGRGGRRRS